MEEKKVTISTGKEYTIREVKYKEMVANASGDAATSAKFLLQAATSITEEEYEELSMKDGLALQNAVNDVNGLNDNFLQVAPQKTSS